MQDMEQGMGGPPVQERGDAGPDYGEDESLSVFLPAKAFGERPPKVGDSLKDFKVVDVDPETGEAEVRCSYDDKDGSSARPGYETAFDEAMPPEES